MSGRDKADNDREKSLVYDLRDMKTTSYKMEGLLNYIQWHSEHDKTSSSRDCRMMTGEALVVRQLAMMILHTGTHKHTQLCAHHLSFPYLAKYHGILHYILLA